MVKWLEKIMMYYREKSGKPWAAFEVGAFEDDGRVAITHKWNSHFIKEIHRLGFKAETEDDSVQLFFYTAQARPMAFDGEEAPATSMDHPNLQADTNTLRTG